MLRKNSDPPTVSAIPTEARRAADVLFMGPKATSRGTEHNKTTFVCGSDIPVSELRWCRVVCLDPGAVLFGADASQVFSLCRFVELHALWGRGNGRFVL